MKLAVRLTVLLVLLAIGVSGASATTWYVRPDGDDTCDGRADAPGSALGASCAFRRPSKALNMGATGPQCGDTIEIRPGIYSHTAGHTYSTLSMCAASSGFAEPGFIRFASKHCTAGNALKIRGYPGPLSGQTVLPSETFENQLSTIFDGEDIVPVAITIRDSEYITIQDIAFRRIRGMVNNTSGATAVSLCAGTDHINLIGNLFSQSRTGHGPRAPGVPFIALSDLFRDTGSVVNTGGVIASNKIVSTDDRIIGGYGPIASGSDGVSAGGLNIVANWIERFGFGTGGSGSRADLDLRGVWDWIVQGNYFYLSVPETEVYPAAGARYAIFGREINNATGTGYGRIYSNVFRGIGAAGSGQSPAAIWIQDDTATNSSPCTPDPNTPSTARCNERTDIFNNTIYFDRSSESGSQIGMRLDCNGCEVYGNAFIGVARSSDCLNAFATNGAGNDLATPTTWSTIGYNYFIGMDATMTSADPNWLCGTDTANSEHACVDVGTCQSPSNAVLTAFSNDVLGTAGQCIAGGYIERPLPFFQPIMAPCLDAGNDSKCGVTTPFGGCDIGAFQPYYNTDGPGGGGGGNDLGRKVLIEQSILPDWMLAALLASVAVWVVRRVVA